MLSLLIASAEDLGLEHYLVPGPTVSRLLGAACTCCSCCVQRLACSDALLSFPLAFPQVLFLLE